MLLSAGCQNSSQKQGATKPPAVPTRPIYQVTQIDTSTIIMDGVLDEQAWTKAVPLSDFSLPWEDVKPQKTEFRGLVADSTFYFAFTASDEDLVLEKEIAEESMVAGEDRVELFFWLQDTSNTYYCLEMDPLGRVLDFKAEFRRKFDHSWDLAGLDYIGSFVEGGYVVEGRIPLASLDALGFPSLIDGDTLLVGVFRADFRHGDTVDIEQHWVTWVDPNVEKPDFHILEAFGWFVLK